TDMDVEIQLGGEVEGKEGTQWSSFHVLDTWNKDDFEKNSKDTYYIHDSLDLNYISAIKIRTKECEGEDAWILDDVYISYKGVNYLFYCEEPYDHFSTFVFFHYAYFNGSTTKQFECNGIDSGKSHTYNVTVKTANEQNAGTDMDVYVRIHGISGGREVSTAFAYIDSEGDDFERDSKKTYKVTSPISMDKITKIKNDIYEDYVARLIDAEQYVKIKDDNEKKEAVLKENLEEMLIEKNRVSVNYKTDEEWDAIINSLRDKRLLTKKMVENLVSKVIVDKDHNIEVELVYDDMLTELVKFARAKEAKSGSK
ncbi:MAG: hypothetical protein HUJ98_12690, partial [Bacteroidaceae bacterium]|nr:hypothetical protein [Bacteroidaceae bacterium]